MSLQKFNQEQQQAITHGNGPLLIVAGAGTGKTTVITQRIAYLILEKNIKPEQILAVTFTEKAAEEMETRVDKLLPYGMFDNWILTFHAFADKILRQNGLDIGLPINYKLLDQTNQWLLIKKNFDKFNLDYYKPLGNPNKYIHALLRHFSRCKDEMIFPQEYLDYAEEIKLNTDSREFVQKLDLENLSAEERKQAMKQEIERVREVADAYHTYQQILLENECLDFGDLINYAIDLLKKRPMILNHFRKQFKYILVDEFQDTNTAQYELIKLLAAPKNNLTVVGDDDQCLPGFTKILMKDNEMKRIDQIQVGDEVVTGVGRGHLSISKVKFVNKTTKKSRLLTIKTESGKKITVTDNHKMFCYVPKKIIHKRNYYVYLMRRKDIGWRMGVTCDLAMRLKLERSADSILAIKAYKTENEARYYETLYSLKYRIPTACFKERNGIVIKNDLLLKLYNELKVDKNVQILAEDLNIDLKHPHYTLEAVFRGNKSRIKINIELCFRNYRSKSKNKYLCSPKVSHLLSLQTSDEKIVRILQKNGFKFTKARPGWRYRKSSTNLIELGKIAKKIEKLTGGIIENRSKIGKINLQHLPSVIIPAKNLKEGLYIPVVISNAVIYDQIIEIKEQYKTKTVYDLQIDRTHNFVADGIVVHNSIYRFRGASVSNIMQFKDDFLDSKEVVLTKNYRSCQEILDKAYDFIQLNNPDRLEQKLNINKKLEAQIKEKCEIDYFHAQNQKDQAEIIIKKIIEFKNLNQQSTWDDFAILVRSNDSGQLFNNLLEQANIPHQFLSLKGLYSKSVILDVFSYFNLLDNYHESAAMYRVLTSVWLDLKESDVIKLVYLAKKKNQSLYETLKQIDLIKDLDEKTYAQIKKLLNLIEKHTQIAQKDKTSKVLISFLYDSGYIDYLKKNETKENQLSLSYLQTLYKKIQEFEKEDPDVKLMDFKQLIQLELSAGETGSIEIDLDAGPEMVKIMTVHSAKGLEFKYVFLPDLVDRKFPPDKRREPIEIPDALIKVHLSAGDVHIQEERRLFYVAMTRAKQGLFFTSAEDFGSTRKRKPSRFLIELKYEIKKPQAGFEIQRKPDKAKEEIYYEIPKRFSHSQLSNYESCPLKYKFANILKIPTFGKFQFTFGDVIHRTLNQFLTQYYGSQASMQTDLFGNEQKNDSAKLTVEDLLKIYEQNWSSDWYNDKEQEKKYFEKGKTALKNFYQDFETQKPNVWLLERGFKIKIGEYLIAGRIDRIDKLNDQEVEIIDYKTGQAKDKLWTDDRRQLLLYQIAVEQELGKKVGQLTYYYLENDKKLSFCGKETDKEKLKQKILMQIKDIQNKNFDPKPNPHICGFCDFKEICEFKRL